MKRLAKILLVVCVLMLSMAITAFAETTTVTTEAELKEALEAGGTVKLGADIDVSTAITIPTGTTINGGTFENLIETSHVSVGAIITNKGEMVVKNEDGTTTAVVAKNYMAEIDGTKFETVADALAYAKEQGITDLVITIIGENTKETADNFGLMYTVLFDSVTFKQDNGGKAYYFDGLYTGGRTNGGTFVFDGVNLIVTGQYMFEGNVKLTNNSVVKSIAEANCFLYYSTTIVEAGSMLAGVIEDFRGGNLIIDGGLTDGNFNATPGLYDSILTIRWSGDSLTIKNGAYAKINGSDEIGRVTVIAGTSLNVYSSKLEAVEYITNDGTINIDINSIIKTGKIKGAGTINVDITGLVGSALVIDADMSEFTGTIKLVGTGLASYEITEDGVVVKAVEGVAEVNGVKYATLAEALKAVKNGETIVLIADCAITEVIELRDIAITIEGEYTLTLNDNLKVFGETTLNIKSAIAGEVWLDDGAILKDSYINGNVFVAGNVIFRGENSVNMLYDYGVLESNYGTSAPMAWTVEKGASLEIRDKARYGLGYGDKVTIFGSIEDALTARESLTEGDVAFFVHGLVAQESSGWNKNSYFTVQDAYVVIGSNNSFGNKPGNYGGNYSFAFNNTVLDASRITFYEATSKTELSFTNCDVVTGTFMTRDADSAFILANTKLLSTTTSNGTDEGNYNEGVITLINSILTYNAQLTNNGTIKLDANSCLTAPSIVGTGKLIIDATGLTADKIVIKADLSGFIGTIEVIGAATYEITDDGLVVTAKEITLKDIFTFNGYSVNPDRTGIAAGFTVDFDALEAYETLNGVKLSFGSLFTAEDVNNPSIKADLTDYEFVNINLIITGISVDNATHMGANFIMALYVDNGEEVSYVSKGGIGDASTVTTVKYNDIVALAPSITKEDE